MKPLRKRGREPAAQEITSEEQAVQFMLNVISATIYSSGDDYDGSLQEFFPQLEALGHLIGAVDLDEVSAFLRRHCHGC